MNALLPEVRRVLNQGGAVTYIWGKEGAVLLYPDGQTNLIDGRSYQGFLESIAPKLERHEVGSTEEKNLIITWRQK